LTQTHQKRSCLQQKLLRIIFAAIVIAPIGMAGYYVYKLVFAHPHPGYTPQPFTAEAWRDSGPEQRGYMSDDLISSGVLTGQSREQVNALLGEPDQTYGEPEDAPPSIQYSLGYLGMNPEAMMAFSYHMSIDFDEEGIVEHIIIDD